MEALFASYGNLARRLLPTAARLTLYGPNGAKEWVHGDMQISDRVIPSLIEPIILKGATAPSVHAISDEVVAVAAPAVLDGRPISVLLVHMIRGNRQAERRVMDDVVRATQPLLECLRRELGQLGFRTMDADRAPERTEELEWLFDLTESLHSNSNDRRAINQMLSAAVEHLRCCYGAVIVPEHGFELTYSSRVHVETNAADAFERSRRYFTNYVRHRKQPLVANKVSVGANAQPFKLLVVPIQPHNDKMTGFVAFLKPAALPDFDRRQLFLGRHIGHQIGALFENQYDLTTGLLARGAFEQDVRRMLAAEPEDRDHSLAYFDIDRLHVINDTLGFDAGDQAILKIAALLRPPLLPEGTIACRIGGDSFVVLLTGTDAEQAAAQAAQVLAAAGKCSVGSEEDRIPLSLSCGVVRLYSTESGLNLPLGTAQLACKSAKEHGGNRAEIYLDVDDSMMRRRRDIYEVAHLRNALAEGRFRMYAQKIVSAADITQMHGLECLIRMIDESGKIVGPETFLPSAQRYQMLHAIDSWVIEQTFREIKPYRSILLNSGMNVSINISGQSMQDEAFIEAIERWLLESMIAPSRILFEITETSAISNLARAERLIRKLRQHGCGFALDDFGTGVNSLSYLQCLSVTCVKIDGSFTRDLLSNNRSDVMVRTIVQMSKSLGMKCVAECVNSPDVAERVRDLGVDYIQGFIAHQPERLRDVLEALSGEESRRVGQLDLAQ